MDAAPKELTTMLPSGLTPGELEFVWNLEGLGLPPKKAASMAGVPYGLLCKPHIIQAREMAKRALRDSMQITREDVVHGFREAIDMARMIADPMAMIAGWKEVRSTLGMDAPQKVDINVTASMDVLKVHVRGMSDAELAKMVGTSGQVIDAEFYEVGRGEG